MSQQGGGLASGTHFERFNALVRNGWLHKNALSETELKVLLVYEMHAKSDGSEARPALKTIARHLGHAHDGHIRMARRNLVRYGLLSREDGRVGGRERSAVRMLLPPNDGVNVVQGARGGPNRTDRIRTGPIVRALGGPDARALGGPNARAPSKEEQSREQPNELPLPDAAFAATAGATADEPTKNRKRPRVLTEEQHRSRIEFSDWWMSAAWPRFHEGATYGFEGDRDGPAVLRLLRHPKVKWDLERAKAIGLYYLRLQDAYLVHLGKPLPTLAARVNYYASKLDQLSHQGSSHVLGIANANGPGAAGVPVDDIVIPVGRRAAQGGAPAAAAG